jgi:hypothetical protein
VLAASALTLACSPIGLGTDTSEGDPARARLAIETVGARGDGVDGVHLEIVKVASSAGAAPAIATGASCDAIGDLRDVAAAVDVDLRRAGRTPAGTMELNAGPLGELRLLVRSADIDQGSRHRHGRGRATCTDASGERLIVLRLVPTEHIELARDGEEDLVARLDVVGDVEQEACNATDPDCDAEVALGGRRNADRGGGDGRGGDDHGGGTAGGGNGGDDQGGGDDGRGGDHGGGADDQGGHDAGGGTPGGGNPRDGNPGGGNPGEGNPGGGNPGVGSPGDGGDQGDGGQGGGAPRGSRFVITDQLPLSRAR